MEVVRRLRCQGLAMQERPLTSCPSQGKMLDSKSNCCDQSQIESSAHPRPPMDRFAGSTDRPSDDMGALGKVMSKGTVGGIQSVHSGRANPEPDRRTYFGTLILKSGSAAAARKRERCVFGNPCARAELVRYPQCRTSRGGRIHTFALLTPFRHSNSYSERGPIRIWERVQCSGKPASQRFPSAHQEIPRSTKSIPSLGKNA